MKTVCRRVLYRCSQMNAWISSTHDNSSKLSSRGLSTYVDSMFRLRSDSVLHRRSIRSRSTSQDKHERQLYVHLLVIHSFIHSFVRSFVHSFIHSFILETYRAHPRETTTQGAPSPVTDKSRTSERCNQSINIRLFYGMIYMYI